MSFQQIRYLLPLLITAGIVIGAHGLQLTLVAVRGAHEGFAVTVIGIMSALYSLGFALGCLCVSRLFSRLSHRQTFMLLATVGAVVTGLTASTIDPNIWIGLRFLSGFAYAGLLAVIESCINANVGNSYRAQALSIYRLVNLGSVAAAQHAIPSVGIDSPALFLMISVALIISLVPFAFVKTAHAAATTNLRFDPAGAWRISPLAVLGAIVAGLTVTTFRSTGPVYAHFIGLTPAGIANFMSAGMVGGLILQYPLGFFSDKLSRVAVILFTMVGAVATEAFLIAFAGTNALSNIVGIIIFGAFSFPLYALSSAHGNDRAARGDDYVLLAASLLFYTSVGGTLGPLIVSALMQSEGEASFFWYMLVVHGLLCAYAVYDMATKHLNRWNPDTR
ncbi:MFS transporter [Agrobacterium rosae]|uniref:MFS transporter n=1 Tax=Agrobacterium rosae TaxID=1972867 RepID=UPI003BA0CDE7